MRTKEEAALDIARGLSWAPHIRRELTDALELMNGDQDQRAHVAAILFELQARGAIERVTTSDPATFEAEFEALRRA